MIIPNLQSRHFMVLPAANFKSPSDLNFQVNLSGVAVLEDFTGPESGEWGKEIVRIPGLTMRMDKVLARVKSMLPALPPGDANYEIIYAFVPLQWTLFASINSLQSVSGGFALAETGMEVDDWKIDPQSYKTAEIPEREVEAFSGLLLDVSVQGKNTGLKKIGYEVNLYGYFTAVKEPTIS